MELAVDQIRRSLRARVGDRGADAATPPPWPRASTVRPWSPPPRCSPGFGPCSDSTRRIGPTPNTFLVIVEVGDERCYWRSSAATRKTGTPIGGFRWLVGFLVLSPQLAHLRRHVSRGHPGAATRVDLLASHPRQSRLRGVDPELFSDRLDPGQLRTVPMPALGHHLNRPLTRLRRVLPRRR
jgi:hypothetical protein